MFDNSSGYLYSKAILANLLSNTSLCDDDGIGDFLNAFFIDSIEASMILFVDSFFAFYTIYTPSCDLTINIIPNVRITIPLKNQKNNDTAN